MTIPVLFKGRELEFPIQVLAQTYTIRFLVEVSETDVFFEKDDQGELRAIIPDIEAHKGKLPDPQLLEAIAAVLASVYP